MRNLKTMTLAATLVLAGVLSACGNEPTPVASNPPTPQPAAPKPVSPVTGKTALQEDPATRIKNVYNTNCASCHGLEGKPQVTFPGIPDFTNADWQKKEKDEELAKSIRDGKNTSMPKYVGPETDIPALVAYVREFGKGGAAKSENKAPAAESNKDGRKSADRPQN